MKRVILDTEIPEVQEFIQKLPLQDGVELELGGRLICKVIGPHQLTEDEKKDLIERGREIVARARERNKGVSAKVIEREVRQAVNEVRQRQAQ
jgi:hypothetical protein